MNDLNALKQTTLYRIKNEIFDKCVITLYADGSAGAIAPDIELLVDAEERNAFETAIKYAEDRGYREHSVREQHT